MRKYLAAGVIGLGALVGACAAASDMVSRTSDPLSPNGNYQLLERPEYKVVEPSFLRDNDINSDGIYVKVPANFIDSVAQLVDNLSFATDYIAASNAIISEQRNLIRGQQNKIDGLTVAAFVGIPVSAIVCFAAGKKAERRSRDQLSE